MYPARVPALGPFPANTQDPTPPHTQRFAPAPLGLALSPVTPRPLATRDTNDQARHHPTRAPACDYALPKERTAPAHARHPPCQPPAHQHGTAPRRQRAAPHTNRRPAYSADRQLNMCALRFPEPRAPSRPCNPRFTPRPSPYPLGVRTRQGTRAAPYPCHSSSTKTPSTPHTADDPHIPTRRKPLGHIQRIHPSSPLHTKYPRHVTIPRPRLNPLPNHRPCTPPDP